MIFRTKLDQWEVNATLRAQLEAAEDLAETTGLELNSVRAELYLLRRKLMAIQMDELSRIAEETES